MVGGKVDGHVTPEVQPHVAVPLHNGPGHGLAGGLGGAVGKRVAASHDAVSRFGDVGETLGKIETFRPKYTK